MHVYNKEEQLQLSSSLFFIPSSSSPGALTSLPELSPHHPVSPPPTAQQIPFPTPTQPHIHLTVDQVRNQQRKIRKAAGPGGVSPDWWSYIFLTFGWPSSDTYQTRMALITGGSLVILSAGVRQTLYRSTPARCPASRVDSMCWRDWGSSVPAKPRLNHFVTLLCSGLLGCRAGGATGERV